MSLNLALKPATGPTTFILVKMTLCSALSGAGAPTFGGTAYTLTVPVKDLSLNLYSGQSEISGSSTARQNHFNIDDGYSVSLSVFKVNDTTDPDKLKTAKLTAVGGYAKFEWTQGNTTGGTDVNVGYLCLESVTTGGSGKAEQIATITGNSVDFGQSNYWSSTVS